MGNFVNWISLEVLRTLGWTLLHFLWQGAGLAALFAVATAVYRSAPARYALAVSALVLMMASPVITFLWLGAQSNPAVRTGAEGASTWAGRSTRNATALSGSRALAAESRTVQPMAMLWLVEAWFLGVLLLSLRTAGGLFVIERMRRKEIKPVGRERYERAASITVIVSWLELATKTRRPSGLATTFHGSAPVASVRARRARKGLGRGAVMRMAVGLCRTFSPKCSGVSPSSCIRRTSDRSSSMAS